MKNFVAFSLTLALGALMLTAGPAAAAPGHRLTLKNNRTAYLQANRQSYLLHRQHRAIKHRYARPLTDRNGHVQFTFIW